MQPDLKPTYTLHLHTMESLAAESTCIKADEACPAASSVSLNSTKQTEDSTNTAHDHGDTAQQEQHEGTPSPLQDEQGERLDESNVFVKFLPSSWMEDRLSELFRQFGDVTSCKVMVDPGSGRSLGYG